MHLGVRVLTPNDVEGLSSDSLKTLLRNDGSPSCWSAVTIVVNSKVVVVLNSTHTKARQASDLAHELSHRILSHGAKEASVTEEGLMVLNNYDKLEEEQADWLSGCLLLPREALMAIKRRRTDESAAAQEYGISQQMLRYRMSTTGVDRC
ncbi:ImmA/IrrE family metallo-endopeptidase [Candidatus Dependentiae bacterium]|nr:ImmA/IrrE family metallo-endopeptidase [Candidatus Dependentiae bacterium]